LADQSVASFFFCFVFLDELDGKAAMRHNCVCVINAVRFSFSTCG
jgi:hypothetical protein